MNAVLKITEMSTRERLWFFGAIFVSVGVLDYGNEVELMAVAFGCGVFLGYLGCRSTHTRPLEEIKADLDAYSRRFEPHDSDKSKE